MANKATTAMAARLRVPRDALHPYTRAPPDCHNKEKGCVGISPVLVEEQC